MSTTMETKALILAAGKSSRFKTKKSKLLFNICGRTMIQYPIKVLESLNIPITIVLGHQAEAIQNEILAANPTVPVNFIIQEEQKGTGHAVACTQSDWTEENILILCGDTPLLTTEFITDALENHKKNNADITFCSTIVFDPTGYGRVISSEQGYSIVEERNCTEQERSITLVNAGVYVMKKSFLQNNINKLTPNELTQEIYLVDLIQLASTTGYKVYEHRVAYDFVRGVNTLQELWEVEQIKRSESIKKWMANGVRFELAQSIHIDVDVEIGSGSFIGTGVHLIGKTKIGEECFVAAFSIIEDSIIHNNTTIHSHSVVQGSTIGDNVQIGPFARLRSNVVLGNNVQIGNFVELKSTTIGDNSRTKHLTYLGDATVGENVNIGAGTIVCNYDGIKKNKTIIEDNVFIGSNNTLIAPLVIGKGAYTAGGSTINENVPSESLAIGRSKQELKAGYAEKLRHQLGKKKSTDSYSCSATTQKEESTTSDVAQCFRGAVKTNSELDLS